MTCIVSPAVFTSKAALRIAAEQGVLWITDPSIVAPRYFNAHDLAVGQSEVVTNHPARTKFARIERTATGWKVT
jgi:hypothetical protein